MSKKKFLGQSVSLDSLCKKYNIDLSARNTHGALKDARLLASVYLELIGGRQSVLEFGVKDSIEDQSKENTSFNIDGEPIVSSPRDAIRTFFSSGIDVLILGKFIVRKEN